MVNGFELVELSLFQSARCKMCAYVYISSSEVWQK